MNIKLKPVNKKDGDAFYFASLPENIRRTMGAKVQTFDIISKGSIKIPKGTDAREYSWDGEFFGKAKKKEPIVKAKYWKEPKECVKILREWMNKGVVLNLVVSGAINIDVTITSLQFENYGAYGNIKYTIKFTQKRDLKIYTTKELKIASNKKKKSKKKTKERNSKKKNDSSSKGNYTVKSGDTLWGIASKHCGGGTNWTKLYDANKSTIEAAAKKHGKSSSDHGHWIWAGTVLKLV